MCGLAEVVLPWWRRVRESEDAAWSAWEMVADLRCAGGAEPSADQVLREFRRLPLTPSSLAVQPGAGPVLVQMETIAYTDPAPQVLSTTLLGVPVRFTVSPVAFTWDFGADGGEGAPFTTSSPGHPYPDQDVSYTYRHVGTGQVRLTTTWAATYTVASDPTVREVPGMATTTSTSDPFEIVELRAHLVAGPCSRYPDGPGCD
ncbi:PKD domain-containing protein [Isoptericola sp. b441]|uniref:PKD domain-containing protein n=1 Tax=Actinotalea lenta TaxID=3064654 RepID=A0ABT9D4V2_9CELL|nr:PKD domain-containing protein [Isoptericola sp. b441]MDO8105749.1 PKD domain-containing protein [Isoptericola sp. b441]